MAIYDTMQFIPCDVSTVCFGTAASMGAFLLGAGHPGKRRALPNARIMIHQPLGGAQGQAADIEIQAKEILCESAAAAAAAPLHLPPPPPPRSPARDGGLTRCCARQVRARDAQPDHRRLHGPDAVQGRGRLRPRLLHDSRGGRRVRRALAPRRAARARARARTVSHRAALAATESSTRSSARRPQRSSSRRCRGCRMLCRTPRALAVLVRRRSRTSPCARVHTRGA